MCIYKHIYIYIYVFVPVVAIGVAVSGSRFVVAGATLPYSEGLQVIIGNDRAQEHCF
jgi:hypothetical protein